MSKNFNDLSIADLVQIYNAAIQRPNCPVKGNPVKTFRTKGDAQKRVLSFLTEADALRVLDGVDGIEVEVAAPVAAPEGPKGLEKYDEAFRAHFLGLVKAGRAQLKWLTESPDSVEFIHQEFLGKDGASAAKPSRQRRKDTDGLIIVVVAAENPHRAASAAGQRFALFKSGQTVSEFVAAWAGVPGQPGRTDKKKARRAHRQVRKDTKKGHIKLVTRGEWEKLQAAQ